MQLIKSVYCLEWTCYLDSQQSSVWLQLGLQLEELYPLCQLKSFSNFVTDIGKSFTFEADASIFLVGKIWNDNF